MGQSRKYLLRFNGTPDQVELAIVSTIFGPMGLSHIRISNIDTSTPEGLATSFRHGATECLFNAEALSKSNTADLTGHYIVTLHTIELDSKLFLLRTG